MGLSRRSFCVRILTLALLLSAGPPRIAGAADPAELVAALAGGGYVLYFRHAATDWSKHDQVDSEDAMASCDGRRMRQLSDPGRDSARAVGEAMGALNIPVAAVWSSEYCRCVQTAELMDLGPPVKITRDILNARSARYVGGRAALADSARRRLATPPPAGSNTVLVAHGNVFLMVGGRRPPEGGAVVVAPQGDRSFRIVGTLTARQWIELAAGRAEPATLGEIE